MVEGTACHSQGWVIKDIVAFALLFWITFFQVSQLPYHEDMKTAFWRVPMVRNPGLFPTAYPSALIKPSDVCSLASTLSMTM